MHIQISSARTPVLNREKGAALLTTMVFLVVLTIIGVSSMQNNRQEQKISTNIQELNHSFQYAESGLVPGLKSTDLYNTNFTVSVDYLTPDIWLCPDAGDATLPADCGVGANQGNAAVITNYRGKGKLPPVNYSLGNGFATHFFYVSSRGYVTGKSDADDDGANAIASATHEVGISLVGPSGVDD